MKYAKKTKLALWTTVPAARKRLEAAAASRRQAKATLLAARRGKAAAKALKRLRSRLIATFEAAKPPKLTPLFPKNWQHGDGYAKPRKRIRPVSDRKAAERALYVAKRDEFLARNHVCQGCFKPGHHELHHVRGRLGPLLTDDRFWVALCPACHRWVHENINEARQRHLIAAPGDWNNPN
jgi:hypothetical protein